VLWSTASPRARNHRHVFACRASSAGVRRAALDGSRAAGLAAGRNRFVVRGDRGLMGWPRRRGRPQRCSTIRGANTVSAFAAAAWRLSGSCSARRLGAPWKSTVRCSSSSAKATLDAPRRVCRVDENRERFSRVEVTTYPGAYHDSTGRPCDPCASGGSHGGRSGPDRGMNPAARADALERVLAFFKEYLLPFTAW